MVSGQRTEPDSGSRQGMALGDPGTSPVPLALFCARLKRMQVACGITQASIARAAQLGRSQMSDILNGKIRRPPGWDVTSAVVRACLEYAEARGRPVPPDLRDEGDWRRRHADLEQDLEAQAGPGPRRNAAARHVASDVTASVAGQAQAVPGGRPRYRLDRAGPGPHGPLGELPVSQLLASCNGVVGFTGRGAELAALRHWRDAAPAGRAALLVHGPGGQGKTRLAAQFAAESRSAGWRVVAARHTGDGSGGHRFSGGQAGGPAGPGGLLVLVDYAERWPAEDLLSLADDPAVAGSVPVRLLLAARSAGWWAGVRHEFTERRFRSGQLRLGPLAAAAGRGDLFDEARDRFAAVLGVPGAYRIQRPPNLGEEAFGLVLAVHMAALAAVDAHARGQRAPADPAALSAYLLDRELAYWQRLCSAGRVRIRPATMARTVFTATLTRPLPYREAAGVLEQVGVPSAGEPADMVITDHGCCYPPADPENVLEPLYPDRLAEDFLALMLPGHDVAAYQPDAWASAVPDLLLAGTGDTTAPPGSGVIRAALTMLVEAACRWPHLVRRHLEPLLRAHPDLALAAGSAVLSTLAGLPELDPGVLGAIEAVFPQHRLADLDPGIADLTARLVRHQLLTEQNPAVCAARLAYLCDRLGLAGRHDEALTAIAEAVRVRRMLAGLVPPVFGPELARSLVSQAGQLMQLGRHEEALAAVEESLGTYRTLAGHEPGAYLGNAAVALECRGNCLSRLGRHAEALEAAQDAVRVRRELAAADPGADPAALGSALHNLGVQLSMMNRHEDALAANEEALGARRELAAASPQQSRPELALSLSNTSASQYRLGRLDQALEAAREAVGLYRDLVAANPSAFRLALTRALHNLGNALSGLGRRDEALALDQEAVGIRRELAAVNPLAFTAGLAKSLDSLAADLNDLGRYDEAVPAAAEAVDILRSLADQNPAAQRHDLARAQSRLSVALSRAGRAEPALVAAQSAATTYHVLSAVEPASFWPELADALEVLGNRLSALDRQAEAVPYEKKAVRIARVLARDGTPGSRDKLAGLLGNLAISLITVNSPAEALSAMHESLRLQRVLAEEDPGRFRPGLAWTLSNTGVYLDRFQRWEEARSAAAEAVTLYRALAGTDPAAYTPHLARSLKNLGVWLIMLGRQHDARTSLAEAMRLYEQLTAHDPGAFRDQLAESRSLLHAATGYRS